MRGDRSVEELTRIFVTLSSGLVLEHWLPGTKLAADEIPEMLVDYYLDGARPR